MRLHLAWGQGPLFRYGDLSHSYTVASPENDILSSLQPTTLLYPCKLAW